MRLLKSLFLALFMLCPWLLEGQVPVPQLNLSGNVGCIGFPCVNTGTYVIAADADTTLPITSTATSAFYLKVTSSVALTATRNFIYPAGRFPVGIENATTGGQSLNVCGPTGSCVTILNSTTTYTPVWNDGTNFIAGGTPNAVVGTGTSGDIPLWNGSNSLTNSPLSVASGSIFDSGTFNGQDVCWHYESGGSPQKACLRYAGHGDFFGPYNTDDGTAFTPTPFSVGQLQVSSGNGGTGDGIIFFGGDTAGSALNLVGINGYTAAPTGTCPNVAGLFTNPQWAFGADETLSYCSNLSGSTWQLVASGTGGVGNVKLSPTASQTIAQPSGTSLNITGQVSNNGYRLLESVFDSYIAFGDSITFGFSLDSRDAAYPAIVGKYLKVNVNNDGQSGSTCNSLTPFWFTASSNRAIPQTSAGLITNMIGTNDANNAGADANQAANYGQCLLAEDSFLSIPLTNKVLASAFTKTGTWGTGVFTPDIATTTSGSTATFSVTGSIVYLATTVQAAVNASATATLTCDGTATGASLQFTGAGGATATNGAFTSLTRVTGLTNTTHSCVVTNTGSSGTVELAWAAGISGTANPSWQYLLQGGIPDQNPDDSSEENLYRAYIPSTVSTLNGDGLNVYFANTNGSLSPPNNYNDDLHPNPFGQNLLAQTFISEIVTVFSPNYVMPAIPYFGSTLKNESQGGSSNIIGGYSLNTAITGNQNVCFGYIICTALSSGASNAIFGGGAAIHLTSGATNTGMGTFSFSALTTGSDNTCVGNGCLKSVTTSGQSTAIGSNALIDSTGAQNTCVGFDCGFSSSVTPTTASVQQTYMGASSGQSNTSTLIASGAFGYAALTGASGAYEIGSGTCATANTLCFDGIQFVTSTGVASFAAGSTVNSSPICTTANGACSSSSPLSGMTATQVPVAATSSTVTSSIPIVGTSPAGLAGTSGTFTTGNYRASDSSGREVDSGVASAPTCNANGCYRGIGGGYIEQWGVFTLTFSSGATNVMQNFTLPTPFATAGGESITTTCAGVLGTPSSPGTSFCLSQAQPGGGTSLSTIDIQITAVVANGGAGAVFGVLEPVSWHAIGH